MVRFPAEWEPQSFVQYTFPHRQSDWAYMYKAVVNCFIEIITTTARFEPVLVVCHDKAEVSAYFKEETKYPIQFEELPTNDTWARDHGAITVTKDGEPLLLDFTFNGWGQKFEAGLDNQISQGLSKGRLANNQFQTEDFVMEGGALESDGRGTLLTTTECLLSPYRNPHMDKAQIEAYLKKTFGLLKVLWLDHGYLAGDDTDSHIDTLARLCNDKTIAYVKCDQPEDEHYEALEKMEAQLKTFKNARGQAYELVALPWPEACYDADGERLPATYANFLIINAAVLVPIYKVAQDQQALDVIQSIFPDREVIGINCRALIDQHGSLHCVSMQFPTPVSLGES